MVNRRSKTLASHQCSDLQQDAKLFQSSALLVLAK